MSLAEANLSPKLCRVVLVYLTFPCGCRFGWIPPEEFDSRHFEWNPFKCVDYDICLCHDTGGGSWV